MTHQPHNDLDILPPALPRRRVLQSLLGGTLTLAGLSACGGGGEDEDEEDNEAAGEEEADGEAADAEETEGEEEDD